MGTRTETVNIHAKLVDNVSREMVRLQKQQESLGRSIAAMNRNTASSARATASEYQRLGREMTAPFQQSMRMMRLHERALRENARRDTALARATASEKTKADRAASIRAQGFMREERQMYLSMMRDRERAAAQALREQERRENEYLARQQKSAASRRGLLGGMGQVLAGVSQGVSGGWVVGAGLSQMATGMAQAFPRFAAFFTGLGGTANVAANLATLFVSIGTSLARAAANAAKFVGSAILTGLKTMWGLLNNVVGSVVSLSEKLGLAGLAAGALFGYMAKGWADTYARVEGYIAKLSVAFKDNAALVRGWFDWSLATAAKTPFDAEEVIDSITRLANYGAQQFGTLQEWFKLTGDMAGAMSRRITDAVEAVVDVIFGGGMERIKEFGINSYTLIQHGATPEQMGNGVARGTAQEIQALVNALKSTMIERFSGGMEKLRNTIGGAASNIRDIAFQIKATLGSALAPSIKLVIAYVDRLGNAFLDWLKPVAAKVAPVLERWTGNLLSFLDSVRPRIAAAFAKLGESIRRWVDSRGGLVGIWDRIRQAANGVWQAIMGRFVPAVRNLASALGQLIAKWTQGITAESAGNWIESLVNAVSTGVQWVADNIGGWAAKIGEGWDWIKTKWADFQNWLKGEGGFAGIMRDHIGPVWNDIRTKLIPAAEGLGTAVWNAASAFLAAGDSGSVIQTIANAFSSISRSLENLTSDGTIGKLRNAFDQIAEAMGPVVDAAVQISNALMTLTAVAASAGMPNQWQDSEVANRLKVHGGASNAIRATDIELRSAKDWGYRQYLQGVRAKLVESDRREGGTGYPNRDYVPPSAPTVAPSASPMPAAQHAPGSDRSVRIHVTTDINSRAFPKEVYAR